MPTSSQLFFVSAITVVLLIAALGFFFTPLKTAWLILRVSPYEQSIPDAPVLLILGDSTGYGTGAKKAEDSVAGRIGQDFSLTIENRSVNGRTISELLCDTRQFSGSYELILLQIGANDILKKRDIGLVEQELRELIGKLSPHTRHLVMMSSGNVGASPAFSGKVAEKYESLSRNFRAMFMDVAAGTPLVYVDLFKEPEEDVFALQPKKYNAIDNLHPSSAGYAIWYETLYKTIENMLTTYKKDTQ